MLQGNRVVFGVFLTIAVALPFIVGTDYLRNLLVIMLIFALLVLSLDLIVSGMGQFSFGHQSFFAIGAYTSTLLYLRLGIHPFLGFVAACVTAALAGSFIGYIALRSLRGVYLAIVTLGASVIMFQFARYFYGFTGGTSGLSDIARPVITVPGLLEISFESTLSYYYLTLGFLLVIIYIISRWKISRFGRAVAALRENEMLARSMGIPAVKLYTMTFVLAAGIAGLSGALYAHYLHYIHPNLFTLEYMLMQLVMLFVGGAGTVVGPIVGSFLFSFLREWLLTGTEIDYVIFGTLLLTFIIFMPQGIYPGLRSFGKHLYQRFSKFRNT